MNDNVNNPQHYGQGSIECIDYIKDFLSDDELAGYFRGNIAKYLHRWRYKNGVEDLKKARWYLEALIQQQSKKQGAQCPLFKSLLSPNPKYRSYLPSL